MKKYGDGFGRPLMKAEVMKHERGERVGISSWRPLQGVIGVSWVYLALTTRMLSHDQDCQTNRGVQEPNVSIRFF